MKKPVRISCMLVACVGAAIAFAKTYTGPGGPCTTTTCCQGLSEARLCRACCSALIFDVTSNTWKLCVAGCPDDPPSA